MRTRVFLPGSPLIRGSCLLAQFHDRKDVSWSPESGRRSFAGTSGDALASRSRTGSLQKKAVRFRSASWLRFRRLPEEGSPCMRRCAGRSEPTESANAALLPEHCFTIPGCARTATLPSSLMRNVTAGSGEGSESGNPRSYRAGRESGKGSTWSSSPVLRLMRPAGGWGRGTAITIGFFSVSAERP